MRLQPGTKNYMQLRNAKIRRNSLLQGRAHQALPAIVLNSLLLESTHYNVYIVVIWHLKYFLSHNFKDV